MSEGQFRGLSFGIPREIMSGERRVAAIPDTVKKLVDGGAKVFFEKGAGIGSYFSDDEYKKVGAAIIDDIQKLYDESDIILKVKEPLFNEELGKHEVDMMHEGQVLITFLHPAAPANHEMVKKLMEKKVTSLTLDGIPRISRAQSMDALTSMSTVAGYKSVLMAADRLPKFIPMIGTAVGMIQPSSVMVIGAGVAGLQAIATAKRLGAVVHAADIRPDAAEHAKSLGAKIVETGVPADVAIGKGGYAQSLPKEWLLKEREAIKETVVKSDILILTALVPGRLAPVLVTEEMVKQMKPGSAIVDVAIDQGGNCELTKGGELTVQYGVSIDGTKNIPGMVPISSTWMFAHNIFNYITSFINNGRLEIDTSDEIIASSLVTKGGKLYHAGAREAIGLD
ncbi:NAD(P) transhydrogenase (Alpha subunit part 1) oxidoreductase protein [Tepidanaerobacter acetatoxydans Re1]|uniref:proton-translocating NAD(P)(+) transhydrogenase n=1 Tax=Tepidanaerobacter acetatoxydans (strain DSM 21804 / JCM 16047 / Re1) TaxID=1209989 RepID=F4LX68_TEPAE|nr:NAD(P) transhydrogenase subunit alpha [Tepidanaerobacter acetatoxydans]AEE91867.1 NAD(P)(+) transhydrogenase (AB-specific) [Tepidanaerobacter acetatoxydans Re1]CDI40835.1 NAD(P) transhydrogenase (Alpha subunit part 1) oxidoreductase protein [Tepidanaerobacter acetatoxydans Re1]